MSKIPLNVNNAINEFVTGVTKILGNRLKKVVLYGSYARRRLQQKFRYRYYDTNRFSRQWNNAI